MSFKVGDVVKLKGDGPEMTVINTTPQQTQVMWHNRDGKLEHAQIPNEALQPSNDRNLQARAPART